MTIRDIERWVSRSDTRVVFTIGVLYTGVTGVIMALVGLVLNFP